MPKVSSLGHVGLLVHDIERSKAFYRDVLGLTISDESDTGTVFMTAQERDKEHHELQLRPGREGADGGSIVTQISFRCSTLAELKAFYRDFVERGISIQFVHSHGNAIGIYFTDPDGNTVEVYWPTGIDWPQPFRKPVDLTAADEEILASLT